MKNDQILYFGSLEATTPSALRILGIHANDAFRNAFHPSVCYGCSLKDAVEISTSSCSWPLEVAVSRAGETHPLDFKYVKDAAQFRTAAKAAAKGAGDCEFVIRKPASRHDEGTVSGFVIVGSDFVTYTLADGETTTFSLDNSALYEQHKMDTDLVYRFGHNGGYLYFDNVIARSNPIFDKVLSAKGFFESIPKTGKQREALKAEYIHGLQTGFNGHNYLTIPYGFKTFTDKTTAALMLGGVIGSTLYGMLRRHAPHSLPELNLTNPASWANLSIHTSALKHMVTDSMKKHISDISLVHAAMIGKTPKDVDIDECMTRSASAISNGKINSFGTDFYRLNRFYAARASVPFDKAAASNIATPLAITDVEGLELSKEITISKGQVRTTTVHAEQVSIRLQLWDFIMKTVLNADGSSEVMSDNNYGNIEKDFNITAEDIAPFYGSFTQFIEKFKSLDHSETSQAGTQVKYVPIELAEDGLRAKEDGIMLVPMQCLVAQYEKGTAQFNSVLNLIKKTAKK